MSFALVTDSNCDFPLQYYARNRVDVVSMSLTIGEKEYYDIDVPNRPEGIGYIAPKEFYARLRNGEMATTSMINSTRFADAFRARLEQGEDVLCIAFSSGLSATCANAEIAAQEMREQFPERRMYVVDGLCASMGQGLLVATAIKMRDQGMGIDELYRWLLDNRTRFIHWFTVDDLHFLKRGGRVSATSAFVGSLLSIKPVMHVNSEGKLVPIDKVKSRKRAIRALLDKMALAQPDVKDFDVFISHGDCIDDANALSDMVKERFGVDVGMISYIGPVVGAHAGPGTLALFFVGDSRESGAITK